LVFRHDQRLMWAISLVLILLLSFSGVGLLQRSPRFSASWIISGLAFLGFAVYFIRLLRTFRDVIAVSPQGAWKLSPQGSYTFIAWDDLDGVRERMRNLALIAKDGRQIKLDYQLEDFARLREFVVHYMAQVAHPQSHGERVFHRTWMGKGTLLSLAGAGFLFAGMNYLKGQHAASLFLFGVSILTLLAALRDPSLLVVGHDGIEIQSPLGSRNIPFRAISGIRLVNRQHDGYFWSIVVIDRKTGGPLRLFRFREGPVALRDSLHAAWVSARRKAV
jgi:hypothetical protein